MRRTPFIVVFCGKHRYCFIYDKGKEEDVISAMIQYAMDDRFNFGWSELRSITNHMHAQTPDHKDSPGGD